MAAEPPRPRRAPGRPRGTLTREQVLRAAVELADADGMAALSMRRLGQQLGVEAMSLYNHVGSKDDLQNGMIDLVFAEVTLPVLGGAAPEEAALGGAAPEEAALGGAAPGEHAPGWRHAIEERCRSLREVLARHPWATGLMDAGATPGPANLRHHDAVLGVLRADGFSVELAAHAYSAIDAYVYGFVVQETALPFEDPAGAAEVAEEMLAPFPEGEYPHLLELIQQVALAPTYSYGAEFEWGLELVLDGLERARNGQ